MSLATRVRGLFQRARDPIAMHPSMTQYWGPGIGNQPAHDTLLRETLGVAARSERAIANRFSTLDPLVKVSRQTSDGTTEDETLDDHALKILLDRPHPNLSRSQLLRLTAQYIVTVGEAYWLKVGNRLRVPAQLHPIHPGRVTPMLERNVVVSYVVRDGDGREQEIDASELVRFYFPDPESPWTSEGYLGPAAVTADSLKFAGQHLRYHYQTDATPKTTLEAGETAQPFTAEEQEKFHQEWSRHYHQRLGSAAGAPAITPTGYKLIQLAMQSGADLAPLLEFWRDEQLMDYGVPRSILGQVVSGDRSSAETNEYVFDRYTILPIAELVASSITLQLAPDFDPSIFVEFEDFVSEDKRFELERETADVRNKVRSPQQILRDRNADVEDAPWGEFPPGNISEVPYTGEGLDLSTPSEPETMESPDEAEEMDLEPEDDAPPEERGFFSPRAAWARQIRVERKYVPLFLRALRGILRDQLESVLGKLRAERSRAVDPGDLFDPEEWASLFARLLEPILVAAVVEVGSEALAGLGQGEFSFTTQVSKVLREQGAEMVLGVNRTTQRRIADAVAEGNDAGESIDKIEKRIKAVFAERRAKHARTIARTEIGKASSFGHVEGFRQSGVVTGKRWNTSLDSRVRDSHHINGQVVGLEEPFRLGDGEAADAPLVGAGGGPLSARNSINCRCFVTPVIGETS